MEQRKNMGGIHTMETVLLKFNCIKKQMKYLQIIFLKVAGCATDGVDYYPQDMRDSNKDSRELSLLPEPESLPHRPAALALSLELP